MVISHVFCFAAIYSFLIISNDLFGLVELGSDGPYNLFRILHTAKVIQSTASLSLSLKILNSNVPSCLCRCFSQLRALSMAWFPLVNPNSESESSTETMSVNQKGKDTLSQYSGVFLSG